MHLSALTLSLTLDLLSAFTCGQLGVAPESCPDVSLTAAWRRYRLERDDGTGGDFDHLAYSGPETSAAVCGLRSGAQYRFRLWAINEVRCITPAFKLDISRAQTSMFAPLYMSVLHASILLTHGWNTDAGSQP
jgi:hypothetical protein